MRHENYKILVGKNIAGGAANIAGLAIGEIAAVKPDMTFLAAGETIADAPYIYLVQGIDGAGKVRWSSKIQGANVHKYTGSQQAAAVQQITTVGYNGASGSILVNNSSEYELSIIFTFDKVQGSERQYVRRFHYTTDATASEAEIATNFKSQIDADSICKDLLAAVTIDSSGANRGMRIEGKAQTYNVIDGYEHVTFKVVLSGGFIDGGSTLLTSDGTGNSQLASFGVGTYEHVSDLERAQIGMEGINNLMKFPVPSYPVFADSSATYDMYSIIYDDVHASANLNKDIASPEMTIVAMATGGAGQQALLENVLNPWFNSCPGSFPAVVL
tara:strand:- start:303 stop:1289 length:987 start_codon:yes stop_codon:yes gene_type:complete